MRDMNFIVYSRDGSLANVDVQVNEVRYLGIFLNNNISLKHQNDLVAAEVA